MANLQKTVAQIVNSYTGPILVAAHRASGLVGQLERSAPPDLTPEQRRRLQLAKERADACDDVLKARERVAPAAVRSARNYVASSWATLANMLQALSSLPHEVSPHGEEAKRIAESLFSDGVSFAQLDSQEAWSQSKRKLERIVEEGYEPRIEALGQQVFLLNVRRAVTQLGDATGCAGGPAAGEAEPSARALVEARTRFRAALSGYTRSLAVDVDETDPATVERFLQAVAPIDDIRAAARNGAEGEEPIDTDIDSEDEEPEPLDPDKPTDPNEPGGPFV
jgi:hypothetical protein